jgi:hypothetical protein
MQARSDGNTQANDIRESAFAEQPKGPIVLPGSAIPGLDRNDLTQDELSSQHHFTSGLSCLQDSETGANALFSHSYSQDGSPDSISLAFPPLPLALQAHGGQYAVPMTPMPDHPATLMTHDDNSMNLGFSLEDCNMLNQRISMFSQSNSADQVG